MDGVKDLLVFLLLSRSVSSLKMTGIYVHEARLGSDTSVPCSFTVDNPPVDPEHLTIFWLFQDKEILSYNKTVRTTSSRYSLNTEALGVGIANLTISNIQIPDGGTYKCSVTYSSETEEKEVRLDTQAPPQVKITSHKADHLLRCFVTGFYPLDIDIRWLRDGQQMDDYNIIVGDPWRNPDRTYTVISTLTMIPTGEDGEWIFSCRVQHESLDEPLDVDFQLEIQEESRAVPIFVFTCIIVGLSLAAIIDIIVWRRNQCRKGEAKEETEDVTLSNEPPPDYSYETYNFSSEVGIPEHLPKDPRSRSQEHELIGKSAFRESTRDMKDSGKKVSIPQDLPKDPRFRYQEN